ncbi:MAG: Fe-S cluster assembly protein SufD [Burkholderiales bacterium]|nr:Fe-S cluster assembly protein SufD [Burkholderiales bacterium]
MSGASSKLAPQPVTRAVSPGGGPGAAALHPAVAALLQGCDARGGRHPWLDERRAHALERANALKLPTLRDEEWRFTDIEPLTQLRLRQAGDPPRLHAADLAPFLAPEAAARLVFVDGIPAPEFSRTSGLPDGVVLGPLAAALAGSGDGIEPHLARHAGFERELFVAVNTSHLRDGALIRIARGRACPAPIELLFISTQGGTATYPRCLLLAEAGADCTVIERHAALVDEPYLANGVVEIVAGNGARVRHVRVQQEAAGAFHIATCAVVLERDATYASHAVALGSRISRYDLNVLQQGEGAEVSLDGLTLIDSRQLADTHTLMDHARPNGRCRQTNKCIVGGAAHAVFNGKIVVRPGAQLTNSFQESRNLLLSGRARVDTKPQLEIFADDVKCAHGATVGQLDTEQLFYLTSRGLAQAHARSLLTRAFGAELIGRIPVPSIVRELEAIVMNRTAALA